MAVVVGSCCDVINCELYSAVRRATSGSGAVQRVWVRRADKKILSCYTGMYDVRCYQSFGPHIQSAAFAQAVTGMNVIAYVCALNYG